MFTAPAPVGTCLIKRHFKEDRIAGGISAEGFLLYPPFSRTCPKALNMSQQSSGRGLNTAAESRFVFKREVKKNPPTPALPQQLCDLITHILANHCQILPLNPPPFKCPSLFMLDPLLYQSYGLRFFRETLEKVCVSWTLDADLQAAWKISATFLWSSAQDTARFSTNEIGIRPQFLPP